MGLKFDCAHIPSIVLEQNITILDTPQVPSTFPNNYKKERSTKNTHCNYQSLTSPNMKVDLPEHKYLCAVLIFPYCDQCGIDTRFYKISLHLHKSAPISDTSLKFPLVI